MAASLQVESFLQINIFVLWDSDVRFNQPLRKPPNRWQQALAGIRPREKMIKFELNSQTMKRDKAIETIKELPNEFDLEELIEKLVFVEKVEKGLKQLEEGKTVAHETVKEITKKW